MKITEEQKPYFIVSIAEHSIERNGTDEKVIVLVVQTADDELYYFPPSSYSILEKSMIDGVPIKEEIEAAKLIRDVIRNKK